MELTDNDRQRIEHAAEQYSSNGIDKFNFRCGAEYATIYEREQQAQLREENEAKKELVKIYSERVKKYQEETEEVKKLHELWVDQWKESEKIVEAERSNIETLLHKILKESVGGNVPFSFELYNEIKAALNI